MGVPSPAPPLGWGRGFIGGGVDGLVGGLVDTVANATVKDVTYLAITDVQLSKKTKQGMTGRCALVGGDSQGVGGVNVQTFSETTDEKRYRTR